MSRRSFLGAAAVCAAALTAGCKSLESLHTTPKPNEEIDLASFRPRPKVRVMSVVARQKPPYWLGWPGTAYPLESERARYTQAIADAGRCVGVEIAQEQQPLEENAAVAAFVKKVQTEKPDAVLVMLQHLSSGWPAAAQIAKAGVPTIVFAPVGTAFTGQVDSLAFQPGVHVISSLEIPAIEQALREGGNPDFTVQGLPRLNHFFQTAQTGNVNEYAFLEETMSPVALETITAWIEARTKQK